MTVTLFLLLILFSPSTISIRSSSGDAGATHRAHLATPLNLATFSTVMVHGRNQLADTCGRSISSSFLTCSPRLSSQGLSFTPDCDGRGPALGFSFPLCPGALYWRMLLVLYRNMSRCLTAVLTSGRDPPNHTDTTYLPPPDFFSVVHAPSNATDLDSKLALVAVKSHQRFIYPYLNLVTLYLYANWNFSSRTYGWNLVCVVSCVHSPGTFRRRNVCHRRCTVASLEACIQERYYEPPSSAVPRRGLVVPPPHCGGASWLYLSRNPLTAACKICFDLIALVGQGPSEVNVDLVNIPLSCGLWVMDSASYLLCCYLYRSIILRDLVHCFVFCSILLIVSSCRLRTRLSESFYVVIV